MTAAGRHAPMSAAEQSATNTRGILAMIAAMGSFSLCDMLIKLVGHDMPIGEIIFVRGLFASALVLVAAISSGALSDTAKAVIRQKRGLVVVRTIAEVGATVTFLSGLIRLPFADASAIAQFVPLGVTAAAAIFLGEPVGWRRWLAAFVGLIGVMIIIKPGTAAFDPSALWILGSMFFVVTRDLTTRQIGNQVPSLFLICISAFAVTIASLGFLPFETWRIPSLNTCLLLFGSAIGVLGGFYALIVAMQSGEIATVAPFRYSIILFAIFLGMVVFGERPPMSTFVGVAIVVTAGLYMFHRERVRKRVSQ